MYNSTLFNWSFSYTWEWERSRNRCGKDPLWESRSGASPPPPISHHPRPGPRSATGPEFQCRTGPTPSRKACSLVASMNWTGERLVNRMPLIDKKTLKKCNIWPQIKIKKENRCGFELWDDGNLLACKLLIY